MRKNNEIQEVGEKKGQENPVMQVTIYLRIGKDSFPTLFNIREIHQHSGNTVATQFLVSLVMKIIKMWFVLLAMFIVQYLNGLPIL